MKHSNRSKFVLAIHRFALPLVAFALLVLLFIPSPSRGRGGTAGTAREGERFLDLLPRVLRGLDLAASESFLSNEPITAARVGVWTGGELESMPLEDYILGVTAAEMPASYELEALKAQAVAARTFTAKHMTGELKCKSGHTICTDHTCCQAYIDVDGMKKNWGSAFDKYYGKIKQAVQETEGIVLTSGGKLVTALYHSSSGGRTENCEDVFSVALPYLVSVESAGEEASPEFRTEKTFSTEDFINKINAAFPDSFMKDPKKDVDVWQRTESGRISLIRLGGTVITGQQLRNALKLRSTNARFAIDDSGVTITCLGFGHGVGMSQCGANAMAKTGSGFESILKHYYTGVALEKFTNENEVLDLLADD